MTTRRAMLASLTAFCATPFFQRLSVEASEQPVFYRNPGCSCCLAWTDRMAGAGMPVTLKDSPDLAALSASYGVPSPLQGCHVGRIEGYVISGHVPPEDIRRLLAEKPEAVGLAVPGMPMGSPGMEMGEQKDRYDVLLIARDGTTAVYAQHG